MTAFRSSVAELAPYAAARRELRRIAQLVDGWCYDDATAEQAARLRRVVALLGDADRQLAIVFEPS